MSSSTFCFITIYFIRK